MAPPAFADPRVSAAYDGFAPAQRAALLALRQLLLAAADNPAVGALEESLKWGEPAYRPVRPRTGTTVRLGVSPKSPGACAIFVNCKTTLLAAYRDLYPETFGFEGERALILDPARPLPAQAIAHCVDLAFTYHARR